MPKILATDHNPVLIWKDLLGAGLARGYVLYLFEHSLSTELSLDHTLNFLEPRGIARHCTVCEFNNRKATVMISDLQEHLRLPLDPVYSSILEFLLFRY